MCRESLEPTSIGLIRLQRCTPPTLDINAGKKHQSNYKIDANAEDAEAVVAFEDPGNGAVGEGAEDGGGFHGEAPEAEELGGAGGGREVAHDGAAGRLR